MCMCMCMCMLTSILYSWTDTDGTVVGTVAQLPDTYTGGKIGFFTYAHQAVFTSLTITDLDPTTASSMPTGYCGGLSACLPTGVCDPSTSYVCPGACAALAHPSAAAARAKPSGDIAAAAGIAWHARGRKLGHHDRQ